MATIAGMYRYTLTKMSTTKASSTAKDPSCKEGRHVEVTLSAQLLGWLVCPRSSFYAAPRQGNDLTWASMKPTQVPRPEVSTAMTPHTIASSTVDPFFTCRMSEERSMAAERRDSGGIAQMIIVKPGPG